MPTTIVPAIPASELVNVTASTILAAPAGFQLNGIILTNNTDPYGYSLIPQGEVYSFAGESDVSTFFGGTSQESGLGSVYFGGPNSSLTSPISLLATPYPTSSMPAYLRGANVSGTPLGTIQAINANLTVTIDGGTPSSAAVNLSSATSFSNAAQIIGTDLGIHGIAQGSYTASLSTVGSAPTMTVSAVINGPQQAVVTASLSGTTMNVTGVTSGLLAIGQLVVGTGISGAVTISGYNGGGAPGGPGSYTLSASVTTETAETITAYALNGNLGVGQVVIGTGITAGTYVSALGTGTGGVGTYVLSQAVTTEVAETINAFAPGVVYQASAGAFQINSGTTGVSSSVSFASGGAAGPLGLTLSNGATQSPGVMASPAGGTLVPSAFMNALIAKTANWVSWMTTWEPCDTDKIAFALWNGQQGNRFVYEMWETNVLDISTSGPSAAAAEVNLANPNGVEMIYENPAITILAGEKAAFAMSWTASINFTLTNGRRSMAYAAYSGIPDITSGTIAEYLGGNPQASGSYGYGINFYGEYTTANQSFNFWQRGLISGPFIWKDSYVNAVWLTASLQSAILEGRAAAAALPYAAAGYAQIAAWCQGPILEAVNFGAIVPGVTLGQSEIQEANNQAGTEIGQVLFNAGWFLRIGDAPPATRASRVSPPCTLWYVDGQQIQSINLGVIQLQ